MTWVFLILLLLAQHSFCRRALFNTPGQSTCQYGIGHPIEAIYSDGVGQEVHIRWIVLIANLTLSYLFAALSATLLRWATGLQNALPLYGGTALAVVSLAFFISIGFSRTYWGYTFHRPPVLPELKDVTEVSSLIPVTSERTEMGEYRFVIDPRASIAQMLTYARQHPADSDDERILLHLDQMGLLPEEWATSLGPGAGLYERLRQTGLLARAEDGYTAAGLLRGFIVEAHDRSGSQLVFLSATGGEVSNDHYPCYELVFDKDPDSGQLTFINGQRYFYDVAGIEGTTWALVWLGTSLIGLAVVLPLVTFTGWRYALWALLFFAAVGMLVALDLLVAVSLYPRFLAVYCAFWVLIGGLLLHGTPVRLRLMLLIVFVGQVAAIHLVNWNTRKPFLREFDRLAVGMHEAQVDAIMGRYIKEADLPPIPLAQGGESMAAVAYRHTDAGPGAEEWGVVALDGDRVAQKGLLGFVFSKRPAPPGADAAAGTVGRAGYVLLRWYEGLAVMIWHDISGSSRGSGSMRGPIYTYQGVAESTGGQHFDWETRTADGSTAIFAIDGTRYHLAAGSLFIVTTQDGQTQVRQLERDLSAVQTDRESILGFAKSHVDLASFIGRAPHSMKGYELYSWQEQGEWTFALVVGTNRIKTYDEISAPEARVRGLHGIRAELDLLPRGEQVFWTAGRVPNTVLPPDRLLDGLTAHCTQRGLQLVVMPASGTPQPTATPWPLSASMATPYCRPSEASLSLAASSTTLESGQTVSVTVTLLNGSSYLRLGLIEYTLSVHPRATLTSDDLGPVDHPVTLEPGQSDAVEFVLRAAAPGRVTLTSSSSFEIHPLDHSWGSWSACQSERLEIVVTPAGG
jgi:hypothetical protein